MPWSSSRPNGNKTAAKYRTPEHKRMRATYAAQLERDGYLTCAQPVCVESSRTIWPGSEWAAGHDDAGQTYIGPVHRTCNLRDGALRAARKVRAQRLAAATTDGPACAYCSTPITFGRTYCSQKCSYQAKPNRPARTPAAQVARAAPRAFVPLRPKQAGECAICGQPTHDGRTFYCTPKCRSEGNARNQRERYRARVGLGATPNRPVKHQSSPLAW